MAHSTSFRYQLERATRVVTVRHRGKRTGTAKATGMAVFLTGSLYVAEQAVSDAMSGRLSETEQYAGKALAGSVVGFLTGANGLLVQGAGLERGSNNHIGEFNEGLIYLPDQKIDVEYLPGQAGMRVSRRITEAEMCYLTEEYGIEFGLVYRLGPGKNGAGGQ